MTLFIIIKVIKQIMFNHVLTLQRCVINKKKLILSHFSSTIKQVLTDFMPNPFLEANSIKK